jgi:DNA-binding MarR family transcriptional regulator
MAAGSIQENTSSYPVASLMKRGIQLLRDGLDEVLRPHGVTSAQLHVLGVLDRDPGISGAKLARTCWVTPQTTQVLLRGIEAKGWVERSRDPENDRILLARLTPAGKRALTRSRAALGGIYADMLDGFSERDVRALEALLSRCVANLESRQPQVLRPSEVRAAADITCAPAAGRRPR